ncbi:MAG: hypothetical protein ACR2GG_06930 [Gemmatimonadaceae bacterium]
MNRPPPYFPQSQLTPPDPNRYRKFKAVVALVIVGVLIVLGAISYGIYHLLKY